jgi:hypothetical protein
MTQLESIDAYRATLVAKISSLAEKMGEAKSRLDKVDEARNILAGLDPGVIEAMGYAQCKPGAGKKNFSENTAQQYREFARTPKTCKEFAAHFRTNLRNARVKVYSMSRFGVLRRVSKGVFVAA